MITTLKHLVQDGKNCNEYIMNEYPYDVIYLIINVLTYVKFGKEIVYDDLDAFYLLVLFCFKLISQVN